MHKTWSPSNAYPGRGAAGTKLCDFNVLRIPGLKACLSNVVPFQKVARYGRNKNITELKSRRLGILVLILSLRQSVNLDLLSLSEVQLKGRGNRLKSCTR